MVATLEISRWRISRLLVSHKILFIVIDVIVWFCVFSPYCTYKLSVTHSNKPLARWTAQLQLARDCTIASNERRRQSRNRQSAEQKLVLTTRNAAVCWMKNHCPDALIQCLPIILAVWVALLLMSHCFRWNEQVLYNSKAFEKRRKNPSKPSKSPSNPKYSRRQALIQSVSNQRDKTSLKVIWEGKRRHNSTKVGNRQVL